MNDIDEMLATITPEIYQRLATAVELGKWPDGVALDSEQKENCLRLVLLWQSRNNSAPQHMTLNTAGEIVVKSKQQLKAEFGVDSGTIATLKPQG